MIIAIDAGVESIEIQIDIDINRAIYFICLAGIIMCVCIICEAADAIKNDLNPQVKNIEILLD